MEAAVTAATIALVRRHQTEAFIAVLTACMIVAAGLLAGTLVGLVATAIKSAIDTS